MVNTQKVSCSNPVEGARVAVCPCGQAKIRLYMDPQNAASDSDRVLFGKPRQFVVGNSDTSGSQVWAPCTTTGENRAESLRKIDSTILKIRFLLGIPRGN